MEPAVRLDPQRPDAALGVTAVLILTSTTAASGDEGGGDGRQALAPAGEPEAVGGGGRKADLGAAERLAHGLLRFGPPLADLGSVADDLDGHVADLVTGLGDEACHLGEQYG